MPPRAANYSRYFHVGPADRAWGVAVTASGFTRILPGAGYPPAGHPVDHHFSWDRGRVLESLQIVLITRGRGRFEAAGLRLQTIEPGHAFMLLPHTWHRYRPDPETGWDESWVELRGDIVDRVLQRDVIPSRTPVLSAGLAAGLEAHLEAVHALARRAPPMADPELAVRGLGVLAAWVKGLRMPRRRSRTAQAVAAAEEQLATHLAEPVNMAQLARSLGVAYSGFRKAFKASTGYAPWQYLLNLRLVHARRQLAASDVTLDEVAFSLGFSSAFHLSTAFKKAYGQSPALWRKSLSRTDRPT